MIAQLALILTVQAFAQDVPPVAPPAVDPVPAVDAAVPAPPAPLPPAPTVVPTPPIDAAALEARIASLEKKVTEQQKQLAETKLALIPKKDLEFSLKGYYRTRLYLYSHVFAAQTQDDGTYQDARMITQRLRLQPKVTYRNLADFYMQIDALDDVAFGDNESLASTALFAGDPSTTGVNGQSQDTLRVSRAWTEITIPVGKIRAGRMTSQWGMGLLANGGDGFDDTFGENHYGATYDRILFATKPITIANKILGKHDTDIPFIAAIGVDRLVEAPLDKYYGFECTRNVQEGDAAYDPRCDANGDGVTDREHGYVDSTRTDAQRGADWFDNQQDDVMEMVYVAIYKGEKKHFLGSIGDLTAGTYIVNRIQRETASKVWIADAYVNVKNRGIHLEFEGLTIQGGTRAIVLPGVVPSEGTDPLFKKADIFGYVGRLGYEQPNWAVTMEHGYASGDPNVGDAKFTGRPLHPDHNVGLLLYEEVLARATAARWSADAEGLWSNGGVYNSRYIFPNAHFYPLDNWEIEAAFLEAWPDKPDGSIIQCGTNDGDCVGPATAKSLGWEADLGFKVKWHEHALFSLEGGYAHVTDRIPMEAVGLDPRGKYLTVQSRIAYQF